MEATYDDAARLEQTVLSFLATGRASQSARREYANLLRRLREDKPSRGPSTAPIIAKLRLPSDLAAFQAHGWTRADTTRVSSTMRRVRDILIDRSAGNPGRFISQVDVPTVRPKQKSFVPKTVEGIGTIADLTIRERQVLEALVEGKTSKEVARRLALSPYTVYGHVRSIKRKLGVQSRTEAISQLVSQATEQRKDSKRSEEFSTAEAPIDGLVPARSATAQISSRLVVTNFGSRQVIASSSWTGRRSIPEQVQVIRQFAPIALEGAAQLADAIEARRFNDEDTHDALRALKELHHALGELIAAAEGGRPLRAIWRKIERSKENFFGAIIRGGKVMVAAPVLAIGTASVLGWLSGVAINGQMLATLCGSSLIGTAVLEKRK